jgi:hypothetical protein
MHRDCGHVANGRLGTARGWIPSIGPCLTPFALPQGNIGQSVGLPADERRCLYPRPASLAPYVEYPGSARPIRLTEYHRRKTSIENRFLYRGGHVTYPCTFTIPTAAPIPAIAGDVWRHWGIRL